MKHFANSTVFLLKLLLYTSIISIHYSCSENIISKQEIPIATDSILNKRDSSSIQFLVLSDWGFNGNNDQKIVASQMSKVAEFPGAQFILTCGDNFQYSGVSGTTDSLWKINYEDIYSEKSLQIPWYPALGNHDYFGNPDAEVGYSNLSTRWKMPVRYYSFSKCISGNDSVLFVVLDTQDLVNNYQALEDVNLMNDIQQYKWLKSILSINNKRWTIVTGHHPVYSASPHHGDTYELKKLLIPLFNQYHVNFYLSGHDHNFEHAKSSSDFTDYFVCGIGGYVRPTMTNERTIYSFSRTGFLYFRINHNSANAFFLSSDGYRLYYYKKIVMY